MNNPDIMWAVGTAHRDDLLRAASGRTGRVLRREQHRRRVRIAAWLKGQLRPTAPRPSTPPAAVPNLPRCAWEGR